MPCGSKSWSITSTTTTPAPKADDEAPFAAHVEVAGCPWDAEHRLVRIGIKGREMDRDEAAAVEPRVSGRRFRLDERAGQAAARGVRPRTAHARAGRERPRGDRRLRQQRRPGAAQHAAATSRTTILAALGKLQAGGSTAGGAGIQLAYQIAEDNFIKGGTNRVILCTDGDFNVGVTSTAELATAGRDRRPRTPACSSPCSASAAATSTTR